MEYSHYFSKNYTSKAQARTFFAKHFPGLLFYTCLVDVVRRAGNRAAKQNYPASSWVDSSTEVGQLMEKVGTTIHVEGMEHVENLQGPCVFVSNHMSTLETFLLPAIIQPVKDVTFVIKNSLINYPWLGNVLRTRDPILVTRTNPREDLATVLEVGKQTLAQGRSVIIFPQGTRSQEVNPQQFSSLGSKLASKAQVPVVAIALKTDAWGTGKIIKDMGWLKPSVPVHIKFSPPLDSGGNGKVAHGQVMEFISENFSQWTKEAPCTSQ